MHAWPGHAQARHATRGPLRAHHLARACLGQDCTRVSWPGAIRIWVPQDPTLGSRLLLSVSTFVQVGRVSCSVQRHRATRLPPSVASTSSVASSPQPPSFSPVLQTGQSSVRAPSGRYFGRLDDVPFLRHAHIFSTAPSHESAGAQLTLCHRPPPPHPASSPLRLPTLPSLVPHLTVFRIPLHES